MPDHDRGAEPGREPEQQSQERGRDEPRTDGEDEDRFVEDLVIRGELAAEGTEPLPSGVTHEVVEGKDGVPSEVRRRRFSTHG